MAFLATLMLAVPFVTTSTPASAQSTFKLLDACFEGVTYWGGTRFVAPAQYGTVRLEVWNGSGVWTLQSQPLQTNGCSRFVVFPGYQFRMVLSDRRYGVCTIGSTYFSSASAVSYEHLGTYRIPVVPC